MCPSNLDFAGYASTTDDGGAAREWWDRNADEYLAEHGDALGDADLVWGPEGLREQEAALLGDVRGRRVVEVGAGAAQGSRWLVGAGAHVVATDVSAGMLAQAARLNRATGVDVPLVQADARRLPLGDASVDVVFTAYGAIPFVPDARAVHAEAARVLRPGGRWVFSLSHPVRWAFPDDPGPRGLTADRSYFDRTPYVERDASGRTVYAEYHRTVGDHVRDVASTGLRVVDVVEPEWPAGSDHVWGGWSRLRGELVPGTMIVVAVRD